MDLQQEITLAEEWLNRRSPEEIRENQEYFDAFQFLRQAHFDGILPADVPQNVTDALDEPIPHLLSRLTEDRNMNGQTLCLRSGFLQARINALLDDEMPTKEEVLTLSLALSLDLRGLRKLLGLCGYRLEERTADLLAEYCVRKEKWDTGLYRSLLEMLTLEVQP